MMIFYKRVGIKFLQMKGNLPKVKKLRQQKKLPAIINADSFYEKTNALFSNHYFLGFDIPDTVFNQ